MTDLLTDTMHERAENLDRPLIDFDAVMRAGDRRRKRRGTLAVAGAAAVCAIVALGAVRVAGTSDGAEAPRYANQGAFAERKVTYATGSTIHYGDQRIDVGHDEIRFFVQTDHGFVVVNEGGPVYLADGSTVERIGSDAALGEVHADENGPYVAWLDVSSREFVVYDTALMTEVLRVDAAGSGSQRLVAVDGDSVYVTVDSTLQRIDIPSGQMERLGHVAEPSKLADVEDGRILRRFAASNRDDYMTGDTGISEDLRALNPLTVDAVDLSPDARYATDLRRILDTRTHEDISLDTSAYDIHVVVRWLDDDTAMVLAMRQVDLSKGWNILTCKIPSGECTVEVGSDAIDDFEIPGILDIKEGNPGA